ncbi:hypothetical protein OG345_02620 [Streptomyces sp. NBC_01220]|uniref:DUF6777 domain-containing protein n=1 Tax=Streptomyces sp. NBC_01220 TaxID=2903781 RepID=UPI00352F2AA1|nr:hypothetical protein OG345_02620 [Streptomyces sp. NBC_01220]
MHAPIRMRRAVLAVLSAGILVTAGCSREAGDSGGQGTEGTADTDEVLLQPAAAQGPDPFTRSTVEPAGAASAAPRTAPPRTSAPGDGGPHTLPGSTPGLYGGTRSVAACDVGQQIHFLAADPAREEAFAKAAGVDRAGVPEFLRGLTPVVLRADTRVGSHGFRAGSATAFQSVLQAGTAVLVDGRGLPRVRCACGNPLSRPVGAGEADGGRGEPWAGYDPERTVVVAPAAKTLTDLVIVDADHNSWMERPVGDEGARDRTPEVPPPYAPGTDITGPLPDAPPAKTKEPKAPKKPTPSRSAPGPGDCPTPGDPTPPGEAVAATEEPTGAPTDCPTPTGAPSDGATDGYPEPFPGLPTDEPTGTPADPDEPPGLVPPMTDEPQTAIELPWQEGDSVGISEPVEG